MSKRNFERNLLKLKIKNLHKSLNKEIDKRDHPQQLKKKKKEK